VAAYVVPKGGAIVGIGDPLGDRIDVEFKEGLHTPKSEQEETALEHLVSLELDLVKKTKE